MVPIAVHVAVTNVPLAVPIGVLLARVADVGAVVDAREELPARAGPTARAAGLQ